MSQPTDVIFQGNEDVVPEKRKRRTKAPPTTSTLAVPDLTEIRAISAYWREQFPDVRHVVITTLNDYTRSAAVEATLGDAIKEIERDRLAKGADYRAVLDQIKKLADREKEDVARIYTAVKNARLTFKREEDARIRTEANATADRHAEVVAQHAQITGRPAAEIAAVNPAPPAPPPVPTTITTPDGGTLGVRRVPKWEITDPSAVPWSWGGETLYVVNDMVIQRLRSAAGEDLTKCPPGVRFYYDETSVRRGGTL